MRRLSALAFLLTAVLVRAETPALLNDAMQKLIADEHHWAFTQTTQRFDKAGRREGGLFVEHYDPSKPFDRQWQLVKYDGRAPTSWETSAWRRKKQKETARREEKSLGDVLDLGHATLANETDKAATYLVPVEKNASRRFPADKIEVFMTVDKGRRALTAFSLQPREPFRVAGVMRLESGRVDGRLDVVKDNFAPALTWVKGNGRLRVLGLFHVGMGAELNYSDFQRVRPYNDRFSVQIGDVKALNF